MPRPFFDIDDESTYDRPPAVIAGEWRECTPAERASLGRVGYQCMTHPAWQDCGMERPDCVPRMVCRDVADGRSPTFKIKDNRRTR